MTDREWAIDKETGKINMSLFDIDKGTRQTVNEVVDRYYSGTDLLMEITEEDYYIASSASYDRLATSPTNNISKLVECRAIEIVDQRNKRDEASIRVDAVDTGIRRAAGLSNYIGDQEALREDLFQHIVNKKSRDLFNRSPATMSKYRKIAFFFIAEELGLVKRV